MRRVFTVIIDSRKRDMVRYPNPSHVVYDMPQVFTNCTKLQLVYAALPVAVVRNINSTNNAFKVNRMTSTGTCLLTTTLTNLVSFLHNTICKYSGISVTYNAPNITFSFSTTNGFYKRSYTNFVINASAYSVSGTLAAIAAQFALQNITLTYVGEVINFIMNSEWSSIEVAPGHYETADSITTALSSALSAFAIVTTYNTVSCKFTFTCTSATNNYFCLNFNVPNTIGAVIGTTGINIFPPVKTYTCPNVLDIQTIPYVGLRIPFFDNIISPEHKLLNCMMIIPVHSEHTMIDCLTGGDDATSSAVVTPVLKQLPIDLIDREGNLIDFDTAEHLFIFKITCGREE